MYGWYERSTFCFVFLPDVHNTEFCNCQLSNNVRFITGMILVSPKAIGLERNPYDERFLPAKPFYEEEFKRSEWFTRAWTLQELLAPQDPIFYNSRFECIGNRNRLDGLITTITGIPQIYLRNVEGRRPPLSNACVAERMRWASYRKATRKEDESYCLLGIFGVNMPLLYGEADRAFHRLQLEIIKESRDESILASYSSDCSETGALAKDALRFSSAHIDRLYGNPRKHYEFTNVGIRFGVPIRRPGFASFSAREIYDRFRLKNRLTLLFPLNCEGYYHNQWGHSIRGPIALLLHIFGTDADFNLKYLRALRWSDEICIFDRYMYIENEPNRDSDDVLDYPDGEGAVSMLCGRWKLPHNGERPTFDLIVGAKGSEAAEEYSLYITLKGDH